MCIPKKYGGLGFKDLRAFNLAMLGKQAWRFLTRPHSLVARLYKASIVPPLEGSEFGGMGRELTTSGNCVAEGAGCGNGLGPDPRDAYTAAAARARVAATALSQPALLRRCWFSSAAQHRHIGCSPPHARRDLRGSVQRPSSTMPVSSYGRIARMQGSTILAKGPGSGCRKSLHRLFHAEEFIVIV